MTYKTQGIILRHVDIQDYHRLYVFLTSERGKISAIARGVRKIKSKQNGKLRPFSVIELMIAHGRKIDTMATADTVRDFPNVKNNLLAVGLAAFCTEITDAMLQEGERDVKIYNLLEEALSMLDSNHQEDASRLRAFCWLYGLRLVDYLGYGPDLFRCAMCQKEIADEIYWLASSKGGLLCNQHADDHESIQVSVQDMSLLRQLSRLHLADFWKLNLSPSVALSVARHLRSLVSVNVDRPLKSEGFLARI